MIQPIVGRIVWFSAIDIEGHRAAIVTKVWNDRMVNLCVFSADGTNAGVTSVKLLQDDDKPDGASVWCEWVPYQIGQAKRA